MTYLRPVPYTGLSTWWAHTRRNPPSQEAGVDYYCRIGTPVIAAADGFVSFIGDSINHATGRYVTLDLDDGRRVRYLHLSRRIVDPGDRVRRGERIGYSGATGYGKEDWSADPNTGGAHVHVTLWPRHRYTFGANAGTLDFDAYAINGQPTGGTSEPFPNTTPEPVPAEEEDDDMAKNSGITWMRTSDNRTVRAVVNTDSGFFWKWADDTVKIADVQAAFDIPAFAPITEGGALGMEKQCQAVRTRATAV